MVSHLNKVLLPLAKDDANFCDVPPLLFGPEFARKAKDHMDQLKAMRFILLAKPQDNPRRPFVLSFPHSSGFQWQDRMGWSPKQVQEKLGRAAIPEKEPWIRTKELIVCMQPLVQKQNLQNTLQNVIADMGVVPIANQSMQAGWLSHFLRNWEVITRDRRVLKTVQGYQTEF